MKKSSIAKQVSELCLDECSHIGRTNAFRSIRRLVSPTVKEQVSDKVVKIGEALSAICIRLSRSVNGHLQ